MDALVEAPNSTLLGKTYAAVAADVSTTYVRQLCIEGEIDALRPDGYWLIDLEAGNAWLAKRGIRVVT